MIEISLNKVTKTYNNTKVLSEFNFEAHTGEKISLIGPNGCGKTTVFKIITGEENIDCGLLTIRKNASIGFLSQIPPKKDNELTTNEVLTKGVSHIIEMENKLRNMEKAMEECKPQELNNIINLYSKIEEQYRHIGGYELATKITKIVSSFKITDDMLKRKYETLSGGEKTIVNLASLIINEPSILLLDEPTNHLDIDTLEWLENYLKSYKGTVIISSHDRYFLDKVTTKTVLIEMGKEEIFFGNYSYFLKENERRIMANFENYKTQQKKIEAMQNSINKLQEFGRRAFPNGENFFKRAASIQKRLDKIELIDKPIEKKEIPINFIVNKRSGKDALTVDSLTLSIGDKLLLSNVNINIKYGEKVCLMGKNGTGKTTLIRTILNNNSDNIKIGSNVKIGYIPQEIHFKDENAKVIDIASYSNELNETKVRAQLARFMFNGDNIYKKVHVLSGGEKVRLKLLELINQDTNFLILDEPTNHIDIDTREILEEALLYYCGTILFISHDRYFINKISNKLLYIENNNLKQYSNYSEYLKVNMKFN